MLALSAFSFFCLSVLKIKPSITGANSYKNFVYFQGVTSLGAMGYHLYELDKLGDTIPEQ